MHMIALGWIWVVFMMAITEKNLVAGVMTFLFYGLVPTALLIFLISRQSRKQREHAPWLRSRAAREKQAAGEAGNETEAPVAAKPPADGEPPTQGPG